jgi:F-type H+-transporting ATPase subunit a
VNKRLAIIGALLLTVALVLLSIFVIKPPKPIIDIKGEKLIVLVDTSSDALDVAITNTLFTAWVVMFILIVFVVLATRGKSLVPSGLYNFFESIIELILNFVISIAGEKNGRRFFPVIATFFLYITLANWLSLTPIFNTIGVFEPLQAEKEEFHAKSVVFKEGSVHLISFGAKSIELDTGECDRLTDEAAATACREELIQSTLKEEGVKPGETPGILAPFFRGINTDLMTPLSFALVSAFFVEWWGISTLGFFKYGSKFVNFKGPIDFFVGFLELIAEMARLISFSFRLFGNMMAGEILLLVMTFLVAVASPILVIFYGLEMFVGAIQAFVFGTLTLVFAVLAVSAHGDDHDEHGTDAHGHEAAEAHTH